MNARWKNCLWSIALALGLLGLVGELSAAEPAKPAGENKPASPGKAAPATPEERFAALLTKATLVGRWAPIKDGALGEEKGGDKYHIVSAMKAKGDQWILQAKLKYREQEFVMPIPVTVKFVDETAIIVVDNLTFAYGGIYSARLMIHERTYSGWWSGGGAGGMLYGTITNAE